MISAPPDAPELPARAPDADAAPVWLRILRNPLVRIVLFVALAWGIGKLLKWGIPLPTLGAGPADGLGESGANLWLRALRSIVAVSLAYWILVRVIEGRRVHELRSTVAAPHFGAGWLLGMLILVAAAALIAALGGLRFLGVDGGAELVAPLLVLGLVPGITEEIIARGILFRVVEDGLGSWAALAISALLFGFGHAANPNATLWSSVAIAIEAGILLGMAYAWTRSLWFVMGLHAAWNFTQGAILGIPVSGIDVKGLVDSQERGNAWISGGAFGAEASGVTVVLCTTIGLWFARKAIRDGRIVAPRWRGRTVYRWLLAVYVLATAAALLAPIPRTAAIGVAIGLPLVLLLGATPSRRSAPVSRPTG
jgi:membrane protease YdiL (CAAX protease family)